MRSKQKLDELRTLYLELKSVPCGDCITAGRDGIWPPECMQFDHVPGRGEKLGHVSKFIKNREMLLAEAAKCDVICANCHAIRTKGRGQFQKWSETAKRKLSKSQAAAWQSDDIRLRRSAAISRGMKEWHAKQKRN